MNQKTIISCMGVVTYINNEKNICRLYGKCIAVCGIGFFLLLYGSFNYNDIILLTGIGIVALMIILTIIVPMLNPKKYRK